MPNKKMERFTQRARRVLSLAQEEAERLQHSYIGTEHLLIGLMCEKDGVAGRVLRDLGVEQRRAEELVEEMTRATPRNTNTALDLSPGVKRVLELAVDEARRMEHKYIDTGHILLGLMRQSEGVAIDVLKRLGILTEEVRRQMRKILLQTPPSQPSQPPPVENVEQAAPQLRTPKERMIRWRVTDPNSGAVKFDLTLSLEDWRRIFLMILRILKQGNTKQIVFDDSEHGQRIEIAIQDDEEDEA